MDNILYLQKQEEQLKRYEGLCVRCGECCGADGDDPCANLAKDAQDKCYCKAYENRLGPQKTISGKSFNCVPIRELLKFDLPYLRCPYVK